MTDRDALRRVRPAKRFRLHDLRHAYAIAQIRAGRDIYDLSHHLGHSSVKVTEIYLGYASGGRAKNRRDS
jgi:integrase